MTANVALDNKDGRIQYVIDWRLRDLLTELTGEDCDAVVAVWSGQIRKQLDSQGVVIKIDKPDADFYYEPLIKVKE